MFLQKKLRIIVIAASIFLLLLPSCSKEHVASSAAVQEDGVNINGSLCGEKGRLLDAVIDPNDNVWAIIRNGEELQLVRYPGGTGSTEIKRSTKAGRQMPRLLTAEPVTLYEPDKKQLVQFFPDGTEINWSLPDEVPPEVSLDPSCSTLYWSAQDSELVYKLELGETQPQAAFPQLLEYAQLQPECFSRKGFGILRSISLQTLEPATLLICNEQLIKELSSYEAEIWKAGIYEENHIGTDSRLQLFRNDGTLSAILLANKASYSSCPDIECGSGCAGGEIEAAVSSIERQYGIRILLKEAAVLRFPDYTAEPFTQDAKIKEALKRLETALSRYPNGMLKQVCKNRLRGILFCFTGRMYTKNLVNIDDPDAFAVTFHDTQLIAINLEHDTDVARSVFHELTHLIDGYLAWASDASVFSEGEWNSLNPPGFRYHYAYLDSEGRSFADSVGSYTAVSADGGKAEVYFVDEYSKTFPSEDRARLMEVVMCSEPVPDYLLERPMQEKLRYYASVLRKQLGQEWTVPPYWERALIVPISSAEVPQDNDRFPVSQGR